MKKKKKEKEKPSGATMLQCQQKISDSRGRADKDCPIPSFKISFVSF